MRSVVGFNQYEVPEVAYQPGGAGVVVVNKIVKYCKKSGNNFQGLGRWSWYTLEGSPLHRTLVLFVYNVGKAKPKGPKTVFQQHLLYIQRFGIDSNPYDLFCDDLLLQLQTWHG